jgi:hypothetical protein
MPEQQPRCTSALDAGNQQQQLQQAGGANVNSRSLASLPLVRNCFSAIELMPAVAADLQGNFAALKCVDQKRTTGQLRLLGQAGAYVPLLAASVAAYTQQLQPANSKLQLVVGVCKGLEESDQKRRDEGVLQHYSSWAAMRKSALPCWKRCDEILTTVVGPVVEKLRHSVISSSCLLQHLEAKGLKDAPIFHSLQQVNQQLTKLQLSTQPQLETAKAQVQAGLGVWQQWVRPHKRQ